MSVIVKIRSGHPYGKGAVSLVGGTRYIVDESGEIANSQIEDQSNLLDDNFKNNVQILGGTAEEVVEALLPDQLGHAGEFLSTDGEFVSWLPVEGVTGGVTSVFGRTGAVIPVSGDYNVSEVTGAAPLASPTFTGTVITPALRVTTSPTSGYVLTSDGSGNATWQAASGGGGGTSISNGGGSVSINGSGAVSISPNTGQNTTVASGQFILPNGSSGTLAQAFASETNTGWYWRTGGTIVYRGAGTSSVELSQHYLRLISDAQLGWSSGAPDSAGFDTVLVRDAANTLAQRNSTAAQTLRLYNTFTDSSNGEWLDVGWSSNVCTIKTTNNGTGSARSLKIISGSGLSLDLYAGASSLFSIGTGGTGAWQVNTSGHFNAGSDNSYDIGVGGRPRNLYLGNQAILANGSSGTPSTGFASEAGMGFYRVASGELLFVSGGSPMIDLTTTNVTLPAGSMLKWGSAGVASGDVCLSRDAANTLAQRRGTNAQTFRVYNTFTDSSNGEWLDIGWSSNICTIQTTKNGTGTIRQLNLLSGAGQYLYLGGNGVAKWQIYDSLITVTDNAYDIGGVDSNRPRSGYFATSVGTPLISNGTTGIKVGSSASDKVSFHGAAVVAQDTGWAVTNHTDARTLDETGASLGQVANTLGTLINKLIAKGVIGA